MSHYPQEKIKPYNEDEGKAAQVEKMFDHIAPAYDNLNHLMSWGIDKSWRRKAIRLLKPYHPQRIMDVATGTGDFAIQACQMLQPAELIGTDISEGMMNVGREKVKQLGLDKQISLRKRTVRLYRSQTTGSMLLLWHSVSVILNTWTSA